MAFTNSTAFVFIPFLRAIFYPRFVPQQSRVRPARIPAVCYSTSTSARTSPCSELMASLNGRWGMCSRTRAATAWACARSRGFFTGVRSGRLASQALCRAKARGSGTCSSVGQPSSSMATVSIFGALSNHCRPGTSTATRSSAAKLTGSASCMPRRPSPSSLLETSVIFCRLS